MGDADKAPYAGPQIKAEVLSKKRGQPQALGHITRSGLLECG